MTDAPKRFAAIGECMIELFDDGNGSFTMRFGGDTLNTAVYMARLGAAHRIDVAYITALGDDPYSDAMIEFWRSEGIDTSLVQRLPGRLPGLYTIRTDDSGERSFYYWRSAAAARDLLHDGNVDDLADRLSRCEMVYLSGVTLSILDEESRSLLLAVVARARANGTKIAFDSNYRPRGWSDAAAARHAMAQLLTDVDIVLPTFDDEAALYGDEMPAVTIRRLQALGIVEVVVKCGADGCLVGTASEPVTIPAERIARTIDTTAAGDSFNAAYLAARLAGAAPEAAAGAGHRIAGTVIQHPGAVMPRDAMPPLDI